MDELLSMVVGLGWDVASYLLWQSESSGSILVARGKNGIAEGDLLMSQGEEHVLIAELHKAIEQLAPARLARLGDEPHWQGEERDTARKIGVCVDTTPDNIRLAAELGVEALIAHHGWDGSMPDLVRKHRITIYKCHTNWDRAPGGNSMVLAELMGLQNIVGFNYSAVGDCAASPAAELLTRAARMVGLKTLRYTGDPTRYITRVGLMAGACFGPGFEDEWAELLRRGCQLILSGDLSQRVGRMFASRGVIAADIGHSSSELPGMERLAELLRDLVPVPVLVLRDVYGLEVAFV